jgi:hypothetical protein
MGAVLGFMMGYVLGAKEGPERFEELRKAWETIVNSEEFQGLLNTGTSFFMSAVQNGKASIGETLGGLFSGDGQLGETLSSFSNNGALMDAWKTLSKSPEIQSTILSAVAMFGGLMMQWRAANRSE